MFSHCYVADHIGLGRWRNSAPVPGVSASPASNSPSSEYGRAPSRSLVFQLHAKGKHFISHASLGCASPQPRRTSAPTGSTPAKLPQTTSDSQFFPSQERLTTRWANQAQTETLGLTPRLSDRLAFLAVLDLSILSNFLLPSRPVMPPVSLSAVERANPPPRKKSCGACIKAKRRCTLEVPACQRCSQRQLECNYPAGSQPRRRSPRPPTHHGVQAEAHPTFELGLFDHVASSAIPDMSATGHELLLSPSLALADMPMGGYDPDISMTGVALDQALVDFGPCPLTNTNFGVANHTFMDDTPDEMPVMPEINDTNINFYLTAPVRYPMDSRARGEFVNYAMNSRLKWSLDTIIASPKQMVLENRTPWCHPNLYDHSMPQSIQGR